MQREIFNHKHCFPEPHLSYGSHACKILSDLMQNMGTSRVQYLVDRWNEVLGSNGGYVNG